MQRILMVNRNGVSVLPFQPVVSSDICPQDMKSLTFGMDWL